MKEFIWYTLVDRKPVGVEDVREIDLSDEDRTVGLTQIDEDHKVSTVFLFLDHSTWSDTPQFFETAIFRGKEIDVVARYATWEEAEIGHAEQVAKLKYELGL